MNCPHCQKELPANSGAAWCPFCGRDLLPNEAGSQPQPAFEQNHVRWPKFFIFLLAPAICCFLALAVDVGGLAVFSALLGSLISGLICTRIIMGAINSTGLKRSMVHFGLA